MLVLAWRNIWRNKRRSLITISSIGFSVLFACFMMSIQYGTLDHMVDNAVKFYSGHIQVHQENYWDEKIIDNSLSYDDAMLTGLSEIKGVEVAVPRIESFALAANDTKTRPAMIFGIDPEKENMITKIEKNLVAGEYLAPNDRSVLLSAGLAEYLNAGVGDSVILIGQGYHGTNSVGLYAIKGLVTFPNPEQNKRIICMPVKQAQWYYGLNDQLTSIAILLADSKNQEMAMAEIEQNIKEKPLKAIDWQEMMPDLIQMVNMKHASSQKMILVLYIVIAFGMFGTFLMMTAERKYEFGILLSIGMKRIQLQITVFFEILLMSLIGVLSGFVVSFSLIGYFYANPIQLSTSMKDMYASYGIEPVIEISMNPSIFYTQAWAIFIIALILSFYPMMVLSRLTPVKAMREG
jgi:ABC-type lipoprotein release transport system permease subunit